jgi:hypothetical protein
VSDAGSVVVQLDSDALIAIIDPVTPQRNVRRCTAVSFLADACDATRKHGPKRYDSVQTGRRVIIKLKLHGE